MTVMGKSEKTVKADKVTWSATFSLSGGNAEAIFQEVTEMGETIRQHLITGGIPEKEIEVVSPYISDEGEYDYNHKLNENRYNVNGRVTVTTRKVEAISKIQKNRGDFFTKYGYIIDTSASFDYTGFQDLKPELMEQAIKNAQTTAQQLADNSNSQLDKIKDADQGYFDIEDSSEDPMYKVISGVTHITYTLKD